MTKEYPRKNGHVVIDKYPMNRLFITSGGVTVRVSLDYDRAPNGKADVYLHKNCCSKTGGTSQYKAVYDIILIDGQYPLYYDEIDYETGSCRMVDTGIRLTPEQFYDMADATKKHEAKIKDKTYTRDMLLEEDVNAQKYPYNFDRVYS